MLFSIDQLDEDFSEASISRGIEYAREGRVSALRINNDSRIARISASVLGSKAQQYNVLVIVRVDGDIDGNCSCPVSYNCKHVVATLFSAQTNHAAKQSLRLDKSPDYHMMHFLEKLDRKVSAAKRTVNEQLFFLLKQGQHYRDGCLEVQAQLVRILKNGNFGKVRDFYPDLSRRSHEKCSRETLELFASLGALTTSAYHSGKYILNTTNSAYLLRRLLTTQQCYWEDLNSTVLTLGETLHATAKWEMQSNGEQKFVCHLPQDSQHILPFADLWYIDNTQSCMGEVSLDIPTDISVPLIQMPAIPPAQVQAVTQQLKKLIDKQHNMPLPQTFTSYEKGSADIKPHLYVYVGKIERDVDGRSSETVDALLAKMSFIYGDALVALGDEQSYAIKHQDGKLIHYQRELDQEYKYLSLLDDVFDITPIMHYDDIHADASACIDNARSLCISDNAALSNMVAFKNKVAPELLRQGWQIEYDKNCSDAKMLEVDHWYTEISNDSDNDWFGVELGVTVADQRINLLPYLIRLIQQGKLSSADTEIVIAEQGHLIIPQQRVEKIMSMLQNLIDPKRGAEQQTLAMSRHQASLLAEVNAAFSASEMRYFGDQNLLDLGKKLAKFKKLKKAIVPKKFLATLRPYQQDGVNWLQFLREYQLNGILADDMGLGKTLQVLAHISIEKQKDRLQDACLIVAPTSVVHNWQSEIQRFCPHISSVVLQGDDRKQYFELLDDYDLILTTYPLLLRDKEILFSRHYYLLVLDEAQYIKNAQAKVTHLVQQINAEHRLCLTGTPLENHLGELWSLFNFLTPGLLGNAKQFTQRFRTPIEKQQDHAKQKQLSQLIKPFLLRRSKDAVLDDLPEKTEIVQTVMLSDEQSDLYESIRLSMHKRVTKAIDEKGIERSQIIILDALLKLRQVCCDPRILKMETATSVTSSAKLDMLLDMLVKMVDEGRRILVFSQFTSMLLLMEEALNSQGLSYTKLTGSTKKRGEVVQRFQSGEVPIFLISLKAGGTGLNLTTADTVIHYDPWWNPAVEQQASDRAHRIGQKKAVFVYKMVANKTVEEKILSMQAKKRSLMDAIFSEGQHQGKITKQDFDALFSV